jgi:hypothetical protein
LTLFRLPFRVCLNFSLLQIPNKTGHAMRRCPYGVEIRASALHPGAISTGRTQFYALARTPPHG